MDEIVDWMEIAKLLIVAAKSGYEKDYVTASAIQVRLTQGIISMTCPAPTKGRIAEKEAQLGELFVERYMEGGIPEVVDEMYSIMTE